jgi:hypothetical protein
MPDTIRHTFEEVPLVTEGGFAAFLVTVDAEISFWADGSWTIVGLMSEGYRPRQCGGFDTKFVPIDVAHPLFGMLLHELEHGSFRKHVDEAVREELRDRRESARDARREPFPSPSWHGG